MNFTSKNLGFTALACLVVGVLLGFIPEYVAKSHVENRVMELAGQGEATKTTLNHTERQLKLNEFALQAAVVSADANASNYADASKDASALFTGLRNYTDTANDEASKAPIQDVLNTRDATIAGLAKADPSVRPILGEIFRKLKALSSQAKS